MSKTIDHKQTILERKDSSFKTLALQKITCLSHIHINYPPNHERHWYYANMKLRWSFASHKIKF